MRLGAPSYILCQSVLIACFRSPTYHVEPADQEPGPPAYAEPADDPEEFAEHRTSFLARLGRPTHYWLNDSLQPREVLRAEGDLILPVVAVRDDKIRLLVEDRSARIAIWIDRNNISDVSVARARMRVTESDSQTSKVGVWIKAGASLHSLGGKGTSRIEVQEDGLRLSGSIPRPFWGKFWPIQSPDIPKPKSHTLKQNAVVLTNPNQNATRLARVERSVPIRVLRRSGAWFEIEADSAHTYVRGFVSSISIDNVAQADKATQAAKTGDESQSATISMPAGVCLFAGITGEVVGVTLTGAQNARRFGGWWSVYVSSPIGAIEVLARDRTKGASQPEWVMCPRRNGEHNR